MLFNPKHDAVSKDLLDAHDLLVRDGWCQHDYVNLEGQHCIMGALMETAGGGIHWDKLTLMEPQRVHNARDRLELYTDEHVIGWNDTAGRTKEEVLALFKEAAGIGT